MSIENSDLTFRNPKIYNYFYGKSQEIPLEEIQFVLEHPLIHPTFLDDIQLLSHELELMVTEKSLSGAVVKRLESLALEMTTALSQGDKAALKLAGCLKEYVVLLEHLFRSVQWSPKLS